MNKELRACLEGYREAGQLDSSGDFTLSQAHAERKLQDFRLPEPRLYVLNLVASAVAGGASQIKFHTDADELWMASDLKISDVRDLKNLHSLLLSGQTEPSLSELALGLNGILPIKPNKVNLIACDGKRTATLDWNGQHFTYSDCESSDDLPFVKLHVKERLGLRVARKFAARLAGGMLRASGVDAVFRYCNRCPVEVHFNEKLANRPIILGETPYVVFAPGSLAASHPLASFSRPQKSPGNFSGILAPTGRLAPWLTLVVRGVNFRLPEKALAGKTHPRGVVYADFLRKDLSQVQLVQDKTFEELLSQIQTLADSAF